MSIPDYLPPADAIAAYARRQVQLNPQKYGYVGTYAREMFQAEWDHIPGLFGDMALRMWTQVLSGHTVTEEPKVSLSIPATWQDAVREALSRWQDDKRVEVRRPDPESSSLRLIMLTLLVPVLAVVTAYLKRYPAKYAKMTATVNFRQNVLYPEIDAPPQCGRPVIFEEMSLGLPIWDTHSEIAGPLTLQQDPSRFLNKHEIASEVMRDPDFSNPRYSSGFSGDPFATFLWLERRGVNVDQLVKRR